MALFFTAQQGHKQVVKLLLDHGATVDIRSKVSGLTHVSSSGVVCTM